VSAELTAQEPSAKYLLNLQPPLVRHFDLIAQAPGGVARLRELILTLAVQGKLVPQDPGDEPASELLKKIRAEKDCLIAAGKIKRDKPFAEILESDSTANIPNSWTLARLGTVVNVSTGKLDANAAVPGGQYPFFTCSATPLEIDSYSFDCKAVLLAGNGDFNLKRYEGKFDAYQRTYVIEPILWNLQYLYFLLSQNISIITKNNRGSAIPYLKLGDITEPVIAIPPLAEQSRIVNRVEELMRVCDALEASGQLEAQQHAQLVNTLLGTLTQSETPEALADNWQRIATHFDVLLDRPEAVDALEQTILQLAVRGLLVPQDPTDEPASVLLQKIRTEKDHLIAQGKIKRDKPLPPITDEEKPFALPQGWGFTRFGFVAQDFFTGLDRGRDQQATKRAYAYFKMNNISNDGNVNFENMTRVDASNDEVEKFSLKVSDFLFNTRNSRELVGKTCVIKKLPEDHIVFNNNILVVRFFDEVMPAFVHYFFKSTDGKKLLDAMKSATTNVCAIYQGSLLEFVCPIPPYQEQVRIVTRVNELRSLCADLRRQVTNARAVMDNLSKSLVAEV
jgi:type I restriction enzyme S subunit